MHAGYSASISRTSPALLVFLLDCSASMEDEFEHGMRRIDFLASVINRTVREIAEACRRQDGVRHYFDVALISYHDGAIKPGFGGMLNGREVVSIAELSNRPIRVESRMRKQPNAVGELIEIPYKFPVYFDPVCGGGTPMCEALRHMARLVASWCETHASSFPPIVMHVTDGEATDGDAQTIQAAAALVTQQRTQDGHALLLNLHIASGGTTVRYPSQASQLPNNSFAAALFDSSSALPPPLLARGFQQKLELRAGSRGYVYNGGMEDVLAFLDLGTKSAVELTKLPSSDR
jgi:hypothetical protein